jgi:ferredoxin
MAKITLDLDKCVACGQCVETCPDTFETDMSTLKVAIISGEREGDVWSKETDNPGCATEAAEGCLMRAISVEE